MPTTINQIQQFLSDYHKPLVIINKCLAILNDFVQATREQRSFINVQRVVAILGTFYQILTLWQIHDGSPWSIYPEVHLKKSYWSRDINNINHSTHNPR